MLKAYSKFRKLVQIEQTLFGLPLALVGALLPFSNPSFKFSGSWTLWLWILLAFTAARSAGMSFNRLIDCEIDRQNPRTKDRPLPAGEITYSQVKLIAWVSLFLFIFSCSMINLQCFLFSPVIALLIWAYSYTKRFTPMCHFVLGLIEFFAPYLGWLAVGAGFDTPPLFLGMGMLLWISGMDILYATQDIDFDRAMRLHSLPAYLGAKKSFLIGKLLHGAAVVFFVLAGYFAGVSIIYYVGMSVISLVFYMQHRLVHTNMKKAFFMCNSLIALSLFVFTLGAVLWPV